MLDKRLLAAAGYIRKDRAVADIGTDHGHLLAYIYQNGISKRVIGCDINEKPLEAARKTLREHNLEDKIPLVLSNGLQGINSEEAEDIVICGMGGELISEIISQCDYAAQEDKRFILQPMTSIPYLRKWLYENGYEILSETPVFEAKHFYSVIHAAFCGKKQEIDSLFGLIGKIPLSDNRQLRNEYISHIAQKELKIAKGMAKSQSDIKNADEHFENAKKLLELIL